VKRGGSFGVRQLAAAFPQASLLAALLLELEVGASKLAASESGSLLPHSKAAAAGIYEYAPGRAQGPPIHADEGAAFAHDAK